MVATINTYVIWYGRSELKYDAMNPLTNAEVEAKFCELFTQCGTSSQCEAALAALRNLDSATNVRDVLALIAMRPAAD